MKKVLAATLAFAALSVAGVAFAQTNNTGTTTPPAPAFAPLPVTYPIVQLGGCTSKDACRMYCDDSAHQDACFAYAQTHGLMRQDEIAKAKEFIKDHTASSTPPRIASSTLTRLLPPPPKNDEGSSTIAALLKKIKGPGGCTTQDACKIYCDDTSHTDECFAFAKAHALMSTQEIDLAKTVLGRIGSSTPPMPPHPDLRAGTSTNPSTASSTPPKPFKDIKPTTGAGAPNKTPPPPPTSNATGSSAKIDYDKPPYHCTPAQAEEGACDPDQFPGYVAPSNSDQGGNIF